MCQKGSFSGTSHKVQRPSQRPDRPLQTNHSGISPGFQFRHCWDPPFCTVSPWEVGTVTGRVSLASPPCTVGAERGASSLSC